MDKKRTAVLIHGSHMQANLRGQDWEQINCGYEDGKPTLKGRLLMGIRVAREFDAELILYGTGSSERDGVIEAQYSLNKTLELEDVLTELLHLSEEERTSFKQWLLARAELDLKSQTTIEECRNNIDTCIEKGLERLVLVSSPWHIERCLAEALAYTEILREQGKTPPEIYGTASYGSTEGVLILEPSHRGDRPHLRWNELAKFFFKIPEEKIIAFEKDLETLCAEYTKDTEK